MIFFVILTILWIGYLGFFTSKKCAIRKVRKSPLSLEELKDHLKDDIEVVQEAVSINGNALEFASSRLKNSIYIVSLAIKSKPYSFKYASSDIKKDKDFILENILNYPIIFNYIDCKLYSELDFLKSVEKIVPELKDEIDKYFLKFQDKNSSVVS